MNTGYWFLVGSLLSFAGMGVVHKLGDTHKCNPLAVALVTVTVGSVVSAIRATASSPDWLTFLPYSVSLLAIPFGVSTALALWLFQKGLRHGHIVTSWLLINLSTAIPTVLSILVYQERLSPRKLVTLLLIVISLILLWWDRKTQNDRLAQTGTE